MSQFIRALLVAGLCVYLTACTSTSATEQAAEKDKAKQAHTKAFEEMIANGDRASRSKDYPAAIAFYREAARHEQTSALWMRVGFTYDAMNRYRRAANAYTKVIDEFPQEAAIAWQALGRLHLKHRELEQARNSFKQAIAIDESLWKSLSGLGIVEDLAGNPDLGRPHYLAALKLHSESPSIWTNFGYSHYLSGNYDKAESAFEQALLLDNQYRPAWTNYGLVAARLGNYTEALKRLLHTQDERVAYNDVGYIALLNDDLEQAEHLLTQAIELSPTYYEQAQENLKQVRLRRNSKRLLSANVSHSNPVATQPPAKAATASKPIENTALPVETPPQDSVAKVEPSALKAAFNGKEASEQKLSETIASKSSSTLTLSTCPYTEWPSACRLCLSDADPELCFATSLDTRANYQARP